MYVRGYLQGSENGRVVTIAITSECIRGYLQASENGRVVTIVVIVIGGRILIRTYSKTIRNLNIKYYVLALGEVHEKD
jgi:positive regulator of sigma E activity